MDLKKATTEYEIRYVAFDQYSNPPRNRSNACRFENEVVLYGQRRVRMQNIRYAAGNYSRCSLELYRAKEESSGTVRHCL